MALIDLHYITVSILNGNYKWHELKELYTTSHKGKTLVFDGTLVEVQHLLLFIRASTRLLLDWCVSKHRQKHQLSDTTYITVADGSTDITSDYDLALIGPHSADLIKYILASFHTLNPSVDLTCFADVNLYPTPWFIYDNLSTIPSYVIQNSIQVDKNLYICIPLTSTWQQKERDIVLSKLTNAFKSTGIVGMCEKNIDSIYHTMSKHLNILDKHIYERSTNNEREYMDTMDNILKCCSEVEGSIACSTVVKVVVEIQRQQQLDTSLFPQYNRITAQLELIADLFIHKGIKLNTADELSIDILNLPYTFKYIYRFFHKTHHVLEAAVTRIYKERTSTDWTKHTLLLDNIMTVICQFLADYNIFDVTRCSTYTCCTNFNISCWDLD